MARQFDVWRTPNATLVVLVQSDLLDALRTRVVAPLLPVGRVGRPMRHLNPEISVGGATYLLMPQLLATLTLDELGERIASIEPMRDDVVRAIDALLAGV